MDEALGWAGKMFGEASVAEKTNEVILAGMERLTQRFAAGELSQEEYKIQFAVLVEQLKG